MSKYTPGPWFMNGPIGTYHLNGREPRFCVYASRTLFLEVVAAPDGYVQGENEANARLIAAAPDLLEALKEIVDAADGAGWGQLDPSFKKARAAIAKATGEQA